MKMNEDILKGKWKQMKGEIQENWGRLTDDDMDRIQGDYEQLVGRIQERYGYSRERSEREVNEYFMKERATTTTT